MNSVPCESLERLRPIVQAFGAAAGMPSFQLDDQGAAAVRLASGARLELEYAPASDRLLAYVEILADVPRTPDHWELVARHNVGLMSSHGFSLGLGQIEGAEHLVALASFPGNTLSGDDLGNTLLQLIEAGRQLADQLQESADAADTSDETPNPTFGAFRV